MLAFARETKLMETTFVQPADVAGADYRNRIWTVAEEVPFAGHPSLGTAADLLRMVRGERADALAVAALDTYFTVMAESGLSGSSFTARIVASTHASLVCAALGAWCAFTGPLHGGAPGPA